MKKKKCSKCLEEKEISDFGRRGSRRKSHCKMCISKKYYENPEKHRERQRLYALKNPEKIRETNKRQREKNKEQRNRKARERRKNDPEFRIRHNLRMRMSRAVKDIAKSATTMDLIGCSVLELKLHLESLFVDTMSWDNYGPEGWHIDHIIPCSRFDLSDPEQQKLCFHYTNLQPLWWKDNIRKSNN